MITNDFRSVLKERFDALREENPRYSGRAFARDLGVSKSLIFRALGGESVSISQATAEKIAPKLNLSVKKRKAFLLLVALEHATGELRSTLLAQLARLDRDPVAAESFLPSESEFLFDSEVITVYSALELSKKKRDFSSIVRATGLSEPRVKSVLDRLGEMGLVALDEDAIWTRTNKRPVISDDGKSSTALQKFNLTFLDLAKKSIETQSQDQRFTGTETLAIDEPSYQQIRKILDRALNRAYEASVEAPEADRLYHLNVQFFQIGNTV